MSAKVHESTPAVKVVDLTAVPYFPAKAQPLVLQEASGLERVRESAEPTETAPMYRVDRKPEPADDSLRFGGVGLAAVMDVGAHPLRVRARRIDVMTITAIAVVVAVGIAMLTVATTLQH